MLSVTPASSAIEKEGDSRRYEARVKFAAHDCDLAMLEVVDRSFFEGTTALTLGPVPLLDSNVTVLGYPIGGDRLSVTRGVVSRIDYGCMPTRGRMPI
jgi:hypothetical protein